LWTGLSIPAGGHIDIHFRCATPYVHGHYRFEATAFYPSAPSTTYPDADDTRLYLNSGLAISKAVGASETVTPGSEYTTTTAKPVKFTIKVTNSTTNPSNGVMLSIRS